MIGTAESNICPTCGGRLEYGTAHIPFIFDESIVVVKDVSSEICEACHEPFLSGRVTDRVMVLLNQLRKLHSEVSVISYSEPVLV